MWFSGGLGGLLSARHRPQSTKTASLTDLANDKYASGKFVSPINMYDEYKNKTLAGFPPATDGKITIPVFPPYRPKATTTEIRKSTSPERFKALYGIGKHAVEVRREDDKVSVTIFGRDRGEAGCKLEPCELAPLVRGLTEILQREWDVTTEELMRDSTPTETAKAAA